jgi:hypothetical protein
LEVNLSGLASVFLFFIRLHFFADGTNWLELIGMRQYILRVTGGAFRCLVVPSGDIGRHWASSGQKGLREIPAI